jgi:hypothetical protein
MKFAGHVSSCVCFVNQFLRGESPGSRAGFHVGAEAPTPMASALFGETYSLCYMDGRNGGKVGTVEIVRFA